MAVEQEILCLGVAPEDWRLDRLLATNPKLSGSRLTTASEQRAAHNQLTQNARWDLILCDANAFYDLQVDECLAAMPQRDASLVIVRPVGSNLSPAEAYRRGAADLVGGGDREHLLMVIERELANAADRKALRQLRAAAPVPATPVPAAPVPAAPVPATPAPISAVAPESSGIDPESDLISTPSELTPATRSVDDDRDQHIRRLIEGGGLTLEFQPIVALKFGSDIAMFEALLRLRDDDGTVLPPSRFFPTVVRHRWFAKLDRWVFRRGLALLARMQSGSTNAAGLCLNLAHDTLHAWDALDKIVAAIDRAQIVPGSLVVELPKAVFNDRPPGLERLHAVLKQHGHGLLFEQFTDGDCGLLESALDLATHVKINCGFLRDANDSEADRTLQRLVHCASQHGVKVVALAVDNADLLPLLYSAGVDYVQGHFISMPAEEMVYTSMDVVEA